MADLQKLKEQILDDLIVITDDTGMDPVEKFELLMTQYINSENVELINKLYDTAKGIEDVGIRGNALMQLLEEINLVQSELTAEVGSNDTTVSSDGDGLKSLPNSMPDSEIKAEDSSPMQIDVKQD